MKPRPARLPLPVAPAHQETVASYVARLAAVHRLPYWEFWKGLSEPNQPRPRGRRRLVVLERLVAVTGRTATALAHALPELRDPPPDWPQLRAYPQTACPRCTARHPGGSVQRLFAHHQFVCARHGYWIGPPETHPHRPRHLGALHQELAAAQRRHDRLVRRHGWQTALAGLAASEVLAINELRHTGPWTNRRDQLIPTPKQFAGWLYLAAFYPETVRLATLFCATAVNAATTSPEAAAAAINHTLGRQPSTLAPHLATGWLHEANHRDVQPRETYPDTRRSNSIDGQPRRQADRWRNRADRAYRQFHKHRHTYASNLPTTRVHRPEPPASPAPPDPAAPSLVQIPASLQEVAN